MSGGIIQGLLEIVFDLGWATAFAHGQDGLAICFDGKPLSFAAVASVSEAFAQKVRLWEVIHSWCSLSLRCVDPEATRAGESGLFKCTGTQKHRCQQGQSNREWGFLDLSYELKIGLTTPEKVDSYAFPLG